MYIAQYYLKYKKFDLNHIYHLIFFLIFDIYKILFKNYIIIYSKKKFFIKRIA